MRLSFIRASAQDATVARLIHAAGLDIETFIAQLARQCEGKFLLARYFGLKNYTVSYAILYVFFSLGAGFGPLLYARAFVADGSYARSLTITAGALVAVAASFLLLGRYRDFAAEPPEPIAANLAAA